MNLRNSPWVDVHNFDVAIMKPFIRLYLLDTSTMCSRMVFRNTVCHASMHLNSFGNASTVSNPKKILFHIFDISRNVFNNLVLSKSAGFLI